jgi:hypothetical protein
MQLTKQSYNHTEAYLRQASANIKLALHTVYDDLDMYNYIMDINNRVESARTLLHGAVICARE